MRSRPEAREMETERKPLTGLLVNHVCGRAYTKVQCPGGLDFLRVQDGMQGVDEEREIEGWGCPDGGSQEGCSYVPSGFPTELQNEQGSPHLSRTSSSLGHSRDVSSTLLSSTLVLQRSNPTPINGHLQSFFSLTRTFCQNLPSFCLLNPYGLPLQYKLGCHRSFCDVENLPF